MGLDGLRWEGPNSSTGIPCEAEESSREKVQLCYKYQWACCSFLEDETTIYIDKSLDHDDFSMLYILHYIEYPSLLWFNEDQIANFVIW
jgi:hypothetical protein